MVKFNYIINNLSNLFIRALERTPGWHSWLSLGLLVSVQVLISGL